MGNRLKEVKSGVRLALISIGAVLVVSALAIGLRGIETGTRKGVLLGITIALFPAVILWATVARWAKWFFAGCCLTALRGVVMIFLGRTISVPSIAAPRTYFAEIAGIFVLMALLTNRFVSAKPNWLDSVCLVGAVVAIVYSLIGSGSVRWMLVAASLLGACTVYQRFVPRGHHRRARSAEIGQQD
jgi:hypothetical protein